MKKITRGHLHHSYDYRVIEYRSINSPNQQPFINPHSRHKLGRLFEQYGSEKIYKRNEIIWGGDKLGSLNVHFIKYGYVKVTAREPSEDEYIYVLYGARELFSVMALLNQPATNINYIAVNKVKVYSLSAYIFHELITHNSEMSISVIDYLLGNTIILGGMLENLRYKKVKDRLICHLLFTAVRFGKIHGKNIHLDKVFNHRLIAAQINTTRETVSREIEKLRRQKMLASGTNQIIICDLKGLIIELDKPWGPELWNLLFQLQSAEGSITNSSSFSMSTIRQQLKSVNADSAR